MKKVAFTLATLVIALSGAAVAETMPYDHLHLIATDPAEAVEWYAKYMGGEKMDSDSRLRFGPTLVIFFKRDAGFEGSDGSSVDHIGFSFPDLDAKMKEFEAAGIKILGEVREVAGKFKFGFIEDPWGTKIEVMEDPETLGFHHIHVAGSEPTEILDWYENAFGGERTKYYGLLDAVKYDDIWLLAMKKDNVTPSKDRSIDHLGWGVKDMEADAKMLKEKGVKFTMEPRPFNPEVAIAIAFVEGPDGVRIELVQRP